MAKSGVLYLFHLEQRNPSPLGHQARDLLTTTGAGTRAHKKNTFWPAEPFYTDSRMRALDPRHMT